MIWVIVIVVIYLIYRGLLFLGTGNENNEDTKENQNRAANNRDNFYQETDPNSNHETNQRNKIKVTQQVQEQGRKLGMLITTIENISKPFTPKGLVISTITVEDLGWSKSGIEAGVGSTLGITPMNAMVKMLAKRLSKEVTRKGGNALIGVRILNQPSGDGFIAYGTAVKTH